MCSNCKADPKDVGRMLKRQGAVEPEDFYAETNYTHHKKKKKRRGRKGCPENDNKAHVYMWMPKKDDWFGTAHYFYEYFGFYKLKMKACAGCGHVKKVAISDEYLEKFGASYRYSRVELNDVGYGTFLDSKEELARQKRSEMESIIFRIRKNREESS